LRLKASFFFAQKQTDESAATQNSAAQWDKLLEEGIARAWKDCDEEQCRPAANRSMRPKTGVDERWDLGYDGISSDLREPAGKASGTGNASNADNAGSIAKDYFEKSLNQVLRGNYTDDVTLLDAVGLVPLVGAVKNVDEFGALIKSTVKNADETGAALKNVLRSTDEAAELVGPSLKAAETVSEGTKAMAKTVTGEPAEIDRAIDIFWDSSSKTGNAITDAAGKNLAKVGDDFGKLGKMVDNTNIKPDWSISSSHGTERMAQRGVTQDMVNKWMSEGKVLEQASGNYIYISKEGAAVFSKSGKMITTYSSRHFDENMWNIVRLLFGE